MRRDRISAKNQPFSIAGGILLLVMLLQSTTVHAQKVSYSGKALPQQLFSIISKQTGYKFFYPNEAVAGLKPVIVELKNVSLEKALKTILAELPLEFVIQGKTIFISKKKPEKKPASVQGNGTGAESYEPPRAYGIVTDEGGVPLAGITVMTARDRRGSATSESGFFSCPAEEGDTLIFRSINYQTVRLPAQFGEMMKVRMKQQISLLNPITIYNTGYQKLTKERATGSFAKPDMEIFRQRVGLGDITDVIGRLDGQVAGLAVRVGSNDKVYNPDDNRAQTRKSLLRGEGSLNLANEPLYVINGLISTDFRTVNQDDIEDITVLKDAAAAAIYGARAANGVIVVTTREGKKNQRLTIDYSGSVSFQGKPDFGYNPLLNSRQYIQVSKEIFDPVAFPWSQVSRDPVFPHEMILYNRYRGLISEEQANKGLDSLAGIDNRSQFLDLFYRTAITTNHTVSASGGTSVYSFYASLGYTSVQSSQPGAKSNSYKINLTQNINAGKRISITLNTALLNTVSSSIGNVNIGPMGQPYQLFRDANGNSINIPYMTGYGDSLRQNYQARSHINLDYYPLDEMNYQQSNSNDLSLSVAARVSVKLWKGLSFEGAYGYQKSPGTTEFYSDNKEFNMRRQLLSFTVAPTIGSTPVYYLPVTGGRYNTGNKDQRNWTVRNQLAYEAFPRRGRDILNLQAGQEAQEQNSNGSSTTMYGYNRALGTYSLLDYATLSKGVFGTVTGAGFLGSDIYDVYKTLTRFYSYFALGSYTFDRKYSIDVSWRQDYSSLFGSEVSSQNKPIWSLGGKWLINRESFMEPVKWVNSLALRATYGLLGNSPTVVSSATQYDVLGGVPQSGSNGIAGDALTISKAANRTVSWESAKTINIGIDFSLFNNRISGSIEGYSKTTTDLISNVPANPFTGFTSLVGNLGKTVNKGIEITLGAENIRGKNFSWITRLVFSYNRNLLVSFGIPSPSRLAPQNMLAFPFLDGYPFNSLFAYRFAGLDNMGDPQIRLADKTVTKKLNVATARDLVFMGVTQPKFTGGLTNTFRYKGLSLSVNMIYNLGHVMRRDVPTLDLSGRLLSNVSTQFLDRWKKPGDEAFTNTPSYVSNASIAYNRRDLGYYKAGDINVFNASYIKIRDVSLAYDLQPALLERLKLQRISVFAQTNNFMIWKANHYNIDPEYHDPVNGTRSIPSPRHSYSLGLNVTL